MEKKSKNMKEKEEEKKEINDGWMIKDVQKEGKHKIKNRLRDRGNWSQQGDKGVANRQNTSGDHDLVYVCDCARVDGTEYSTIMHAQLSEALTVR